MDSYFALWYKLGSYRDITTIMENHMGWEREWTTKWRVGLPFRFAVWGFSKIKGTIVGVPIIRTIVFWGLYWSPLNLGNYRVSGVSERTGSLSL